MTVWTHVLVAYGSKRGSTREVAEAIGGTLREQGLVVDVRPAAEVEDLAFYDGVVLGGSLYFGRWHEDALAFLKRHRPALADRPLAIFALGPKTTAERDLAESRAQLDRALAGVEPTMVAVFGGVIDPTKLRFPFNRMPASDARDRTEIAAWANEVASLFAGEPGDRAPSLPSLDEPSVRELRRLDLLDELRRKRAALEYEPQLDPEGRRRAALTELISTFEELELQALQELREEVTV
jgi:menaquinone-dependent protoporphyrinogen oxidase